MYMGNALRINSTAMNVGRNRPKLTFVANATADVTLTIAGSNGLIDWGDGTTTPLTVAEQSYTHNVANGNVVTITQMQNVTKFMHTNSTTLTFSLAQFSNLTNLIYLHLYNTSVTGDIADISNLTNLAYLYLGSTSVTGDIADISNLTNLTYLYLSGTSVTGDIADISNLTNLTRLSLHSTSVTYTTITLPDWSNATIYVNNCNWDTSTVDTFLIDLDASGISDATIYMDGTNAARSSNSDTAVTNLEGRNNTISVNT